MKKSCKHDSTARRQSVRRAVPVRNSPSPRGKKDREILRLRRQLAAERRRTAKLEREVSDLKRELQAGLLAKQEQPLRHLHRKATGIRREERLLDEANRRAHHYRKASFLRYVWESVMESAPVLVLSKLTQYLRRVRAVQIILSIVLAVGALVTVAILSAAVLPFLFFGIGIIAILGTLRSKRMNELLRRELRGKQIRVFIPPRGASLSEDSFFMRNARAMADEGEYVLVVSPYLLSNRGLGGRGGYFTARKEADGLYLLRKRYFFILRRRVLDTFERDVTIVY